MVFLLFAHEWKVDATINAVPSVTVRAVKNARPAHETHTTILNAAATIRISSLQANVAVEGDRNVLLTRRAPHRPPATSPRVQGARGVTNAAQKSLHNRKKETR